MKIVIYTISKVRQDFIKSGEEEFLARISKWCAVGLEELSAQAPDSMPAGEARALEAKALLSRLKDDDFLVVLDERGRQLNTEGFADLISKKLKSGSNKLCFAIGGAHGWDNSVRERANLLLSLSSLTFPFQMARLILIEQIYRAFSILNNIPYHK